MRKTTMKQKAADDIKRLRGDSAKKLSDAISNVLAAEENKVAEQKERERLRRRRREQLRVRD